jgi:hypothetical protein
MSTVSQYRPLSRLARLLATGWLVLFGAVWGGLPLADAATGHPGVSHAQLDGDAGAQLVGADSTCLLCDLLATPVLSAYPVAPSAASTFPLVVAAVSSAAPSVAAQFRADAARPPPGQ